MSGRVRGKKQAACSANVGAAGVCSQIVHKFRGTHTHTHTSGMCEDERWEGEGAGINPHYGLICIALGCRRRRGLGGPYEVSTSCDFNRS